MAGNRDNVRVYDLADVYTAPVGTAGPTDIATALNALFTPVGLLSEDGINRTRDVDRTEHRSYGGVIVKATRTAQTLSFGFTALENTDKVFKLANPGSTSATVTLITTRTVKAQVSAEVAMVIHLVEGSGVGAKATRIHIPKVEVFQDGDTAYNADNMVQSEMTGIVYPASDGTFFFEITDDPGAVAP